MSSSSSPVARPMSARGRSPSPNCVFRTPRKPKSRSMSPPGPRRKRSKTVPTNKTNIFEEFRIRTSPRKDRPISPYGKSLIPTPISSPQTSLSTSPSSSPRQLTSTQSSRHSSPTPRMMTPLSRSPSPTMSLRRNLSPPSSPGRRMNLSPPSSPGRRRNLSPPSSPGRRSRSSPSPSSRSSPVPQKNHTSSPNKAQTVWRKDREEEDHSPIMVLKNKWIQIAANDQPLIPSTVISILTELDRLTEEPFISDVFGKKLGKAIAARLAVSKNMGWYIDTLHMLCPQMHTEIFQRIRRAASPMLGPDEVWREIRFQLGPISNNNFGKDFLKRLRKIFWILILESDLTKIELTDLFLDIVGVDEPGEIFPLYTQLFKEFVCNKQNMRYIKLPSKKAFAAAAEEEEEEVYEDACTYYYCDGDKIPPAEPKETWGFRNIKNSRNIRVGTNKNGKTSLQYSGNTPETNDIQQTMTMVPLEDIKPLLKKSHSQGESLRFRAIDVNIGKVRSAPTYTQANKPFRHFHKRPGSPAARGKPEGHPIELEYENAAIEDNIIVEADKGSYRQHHLANKKQRQKAARMKDNSKKTSSSSSNASSKSSSKKQTKSDTMSDFSKSIFDDEISDKNTCDNVQKHFCYSGADYSFSFGDLKKKIDKIHNRPKSNSGHGHGEKKHIPIWERKAEPHFCYRKIEPITHIPNRKKIHSSNSKANLQGRDKASEVLLEIHPCTSKESTRTPRGAENMAKNRPILIGGT